jgi:hypothetical protein
MAIVEKIKILLDKVSAQKDAEAFGASMAESMIESQRAVQAFNKAWRVLSDQIKAGVTDAAEYERTNLALNAALKGAGFEVEKNNKALNAQSGELERITGISDEVIRKTQALAINTGVNVTQVDRFTRAAVSMSNTLGRDVNSSMEALIKLQTGVIDRNLKLIPGINELTKEQLASGEAIDLINAAWGENLDLLNQGITGQVNQLGVAWANYRENVAVAIMETDLVRFALEGLTTAVDEMSEVFQEEGFLASVYSFFDVVAFGGEQTLRIREQRKNIERLTKETRAIAAESEQLRRENQANLEIAIGLGVDFAEFGGVFGEGEVSVRKGRKKKRKGFDEAGILSQIGAGVDKLAEQKKKEHSQVMNDLETSITDWKAQQEERRLEIAIQASNDQFDIEQQNAENFQQWSEARIAQSEKEAATRAASFQDMAGSVAAVGADFANTMLTGFIALAEGSSVAFDRLAKDFLVSTGTQLVAEGIKTSFIGTARALFGDPLGVAAAIQGAAMVAAGLPMLAGGLAIQAPPGPAIQPAGAGAGTGAVGGGGGTPAPAPAAGQQASGPPVNANFFVVGELTPQQAITINRGLAEAAAQGF